MDLKDLLSNQIFLFALMLFGTLLSMAKQYVDGRMNAATIDFGAYLLRIETLIAVGANVIAFLGLIDSGQLNFLSAVGVGYALNSLTDLKPGGRSAAIVESIPDSKE